MRAQEIFKELRKLNLLILRGELDDKQKLATEQKIKELTQENKELNKKWLSTMEII